MFERVLKVKYLSSKTCFVYLSGRLINIHRVIYLKLSYCTKSGYFSVCTLDSLDTDTIGISSLYAKALGIKENDYITVSQIEQLSVVNGLSIIPKNKSDYEVLEVFAQDVQSSLLDQVRVVNEQQNLVIWIGNSISVTVDVGNVRPVSPGIIDFLTEVEIKSPNEKRDIIGDFSSQVESNYLKNLTKPTLSFQNNSNAEINTFRKFFISKSELVYRILPLNECPGLKKIIDRYPPFCGFVSRKGCYGEYFHANTTHFYKMRVLAKQNDKNVYIRLYFLEDILDVDINNENIFVPDIILDVLEVSFCSRVSLKMIDTKPFIKEIEMHCKKNYLLNVVEKLKLFLADNCKESLLLNSNIPINIGSDIHCFLKFLPDPVDFCVVDEEFLRNCSFSLHSEEVKPLEKFDIKLKQSDSFYWNVSPFSNILSKVLQILTSCNVFFPENCIIIGRPGMGKSSFLTHLSGILMKYPYFVYNETIYCKQIKGKTVDSLQKYFSDCFAKLILCQPSLLVLDDFHVLCEGAKGDETPNTLYCNRVSEILYNIFSQFTAQNAIGIIASVDSISNINRHVYRSRGNHLFKNVFNLDELHKGDRVALLKYYFLSHNVSDVDFNDLSVRTDGFVIQDIADLCSKIRFEACKEGSVNQPLIIKQIHCDEALKKSCALSLQNIKFSASKGKTFEDVGGLHDIKNILIENFLWPIQYPTLFSGAPLRLPSGMLLYGPPGSGKTLVASAAANQCSLRLISVKGPELLSKYIGASEQSVRDVFEKAQRARPCIVFFDEFESLAPRRGHDNTGVTDRVVNQLLTHLDGIESLIGVCVLAATSRPDLLDPALLRPGRLDKQLLCPMPDKESRKEILSVLSRGLDLDNDVNFDQIASLTDDYSGADLQSLLYSAQLDCFKEDGSSILLTSPISQNSLLEALKRTRPSLTRNERLKYEKIYAKFRGELREDLPSGFKVTLA
ncbi:peroxisomal ATPase PEX1 [Cylas formicarius]|uniref:peroxisomal ATPase PEX1 n=1 Tax=Cylas formicarius TaxID=197179 RepID=UPI002958A826|nr:peroxisomal ATPase PEX1 [Cylas formicarius]